MKRILPLCLFFLILFITLTSLASSADEKNPAILSASIEAEKTHALVQAYIPPAMVERNEGQLLYLFALDPGQIDADLSTLTPIASVRIETKVDFRFQIEGLLSDRIFARYQLALLDADRYVAIGQGAYLDNPSLLSSIKDPFPQATSKKGLQTRLYTDAQRLGISHTTVTVPINELLSSSATTASFRYLDKVYYLDPTRLDLLDYQVRRFSQAGVIVYLDLVLTKPTTSAFSHLYYAASAAAVSFYAYHIEDPDAAHLLEGLVTFLTSRYTRPDRAYGFAAAYIVGYEVNSGRYRNYRGAASLDEAAYSYAKLVRHVATAARSVYQNAKIYISLGNNWNTASIDPSVTPSSMLDYPAHAFLTSFLSHMNALGAPIDWSVAVNPYPSSLALTAFWKDEKATSSLDSPYLTMANIELLTDLLKTEDYTAGDITRTVLISEFGVSGQINTANEPLQAAAFVYAYCKAIANDRIDALIWHRQVDHVGEEDLYFGLWSCVNSTLLTPDEQKQIYEVFRTIDTTATGQTSPTAFTLDLIDDPAFAPLLNAVTPSLSQKTLFEAIAQPNTTATMNEVTLFRFEDSGALGFYPSDAARYLEIREDTDLGHVLYASLFPTEEIEYAGIANYGSTLPDLSSQSALSIRLKAAHGSSKEPVTLMLRMTGKDKDGKALIYEGTTTVNPGVDSTLYFPIADFAAECTTLDSLKIWIRGHKDDTQNGNSEECYLAIASLSLLRPSSSSSLQTILTVAVVIVIPVVLILVITLLSFTYRAALLKSSKNLHRLSGHHRYHIDKIAHKKDEE